MTTQLDRTKHIAFEVEQLATRRNYTFEWKPQTNEMMVWDTSIRVGKKHFDEDTSEVAWERFVDTYMRALKDMSAPFLWWVDAETFQPIDPNAPSGFSLVFTVMENLAPGGHEKWLYTTVTDGQVVFEEDFDIYSLFESLEQLEEFVRQVPIPGVDLKVIEVSNGVDKLAVPFKKDGGVVVDAESNPKGHLLRFQDHGEDFYYYKVLGATLKDGQWQPNYGCTKDFSEATIFGSEMQVVEAGQNDPAGIILQSDTLMAIPLIYGVVQQPVAYSLMYRRVTSPTIR